MRLTAIDGQRYTHRRTVLDIEACAAELLHLRRMHYHVAEIAPGEKACGADVDQRDAGNPNKDACQVGCPLRLRPPRTASTCQSNKPKNGCDNKLTAADEIGHGIVTSGA